MTTNKMKFKTMWQFFLRKKMFYLFKMSQNASRTKRKNVQSTAWNIPHILFLSIYFASFTPNLILRHRPIFFFSGIISTSFQSSLSAAAESAGESSWVHVWPLRCGILLTRCAAGHDPGLRVCPLSSIYWLVN